MPVVYDLGPLDIDRLAQIVESDFREMPGMRLTRAQAQRLWNLTAEVCERLLSQLTAQGRLVRDRAGQYCTRPDSY